MGHIASYTPADIVARYKRVRGFNVLHPMGYDAFGLPAEQYAIQTGIHPAETTNKAIENFRRQLQSFGFCFDWSCEISTCDPAYYKWTQFIFLKLYEKGLAYQKEVPVNWCPALKTVLANDEVIDGKSERGGHPVVRIPMKQWLLKITDYADRLSEDLDKVDWPERTKEAQKNWIGKSEGALVRFSVGGQESIEVFTTRPDTLFGVSFLVLAPEHPAVPRITASERKSAVERYVAATSSKSEVDRKASNEKTGEFTGSYATHPFTGKQIPIWIADYVLLDYGTGAIMAVPGHDERDFEFAQKFELPILRVLESRETEKNELPMTGHGVCVHSEFLNGLEQNVATPRAIQELEKKGLGEKKIQYKLRDWLFSRQRYWGEPFPIVRFPKAGLRAVPYDELPVLLPQVADYEPTEKGEPPLARVPEFVNYKGKVSQNAESEMGQRETDTMPGSAGSSWYFLRYTDPKNSQAPFSFENQKYWMPVDLYVGGAEHTVGHLLYSRFWQKVLFDAGLVSHEEPFQKLAHQGMILGPDGEKMSKSRGNVINVDEIREQFGADVLRAYICFLGPLDKDKPWSPTGIDGVKRFIDRVWRYCFNDQGQVQVKEGPMPMELEKVLHKTIKKVTEDIETMSFNTCISALMILMNEGYKHEFKSKNFLLVFSQLLMPFAPHIAEEIWEKLGGQDYCSRAPWPAFNPELCKEDAVTMGVQVNGKMRGTIEVQLTTSEQEAVALALQITAVSQSLGGQTYQKVIYKPGKILNIISSQK
jgi:leucyl-tRNA synthetase